MQRREAVTAVSSVPAVVVALASELRTDRTVINLYCTTKSVTIVTKVTYRQVNSQELGHTVQATYYQILYKFIFIFFALTYSIICNVIYNIMKIPFI